MFSFPKTHHSIPLLILLYILPSPTVPYRVFDSRDRVTRSAIQQCRGSTPPQLESQQAECYELLRCILTTIPSDFTARWSAGANILAFVPTIVALLSNSINEISSIADESNVLAVALSLSSVTAFISRFGDMPMRASEAFFHEDNRRSERLRAAWKKLDSIMHDTEKKGQTPLWRHRRIRDLVLCLLLLFLSAGIWYEVYQTTRYGIIVNACPIKVNVGLWVGLSQLLSLFNIACRRFSFDVRTVAFRYRDPRQRGPGPPGAPSSNTHPQQSFSIVLRSPRDTYLRWALQTLTAIASFTLYAFGTVILASTTLIPASDAIRTLAVSTIGAGVARLVGYWAASPSRTGNRTLVVDVPADCLKEFYDEVQAKARANI